MIGILIALLVGVAVGQDANKRGMSAWGWGIGVFLLLIVFLPLYFIMRKPKLEDQAKVQQDTDSSDEILDDFEIE